MKFGFAFSLALCAGAIAATDSASGATLSVVDYNALPEPLNMLSLGDNGAQTIPSARFLNGDVYPLLSLIYLQSSEIGYFNFSLDYSSPTTEYAITRVLTGDVDFSTGFVSNGSSIFGSGPTTVDATTPLTISGSVRFNAAQTYSLLAGLYGGSYGEGYQEGVGTIDLTWDYGGTAEYKLLSGGGGGVSAVPEPSTWAMLLLGFAGLSFAGFRKTRDVAKMAKA